MKQKIKQLLVAIVGLLLSTSAFAHDFEVNGIYYEYLFKTDKTVSVTYKGNSYNSYTNEYSGTITIPSSVTYSGSTYSVTSIDNSAFYDCNRLTSITIPNSVTSIGDYAFYGCKGLTSITIPNSVTSIGDYAFYSCSNIHSFTIGSGISSISSNTFSVKPKKTIWQTNTPPSGSSYASGTVNYVANEQYSSLSNVVVYPYLSSMFEVDGVKYVPISPSERTCDAIDCSYNLSDSIINIGNTVSFKGVAMTVKDIKPYTCYGNDYIKTCTINYNGIIGEYAFNGCSAIETITLGNELETIGNSTFYGCS